MPILLAARLLAKGGMTMQRITRNRRLTPKEAEKNREIRRKVKAELPELIARHHERTVNLGKGKRNA